MLCVDVARVFWDLIRSLRGATEAERALWGLVRDGRVHDVDLFEELVAVAEVGGLPSESHGIEGLSHAGVSVGRPETGSSTSGQISFGSGFDLAARATVVYEKFTASSPRFRNIESALNRDDSRLMKYGLLGDSLQVQGAIALGHAAGRGVSIHRDLEEDLTAILEDSYRQSSAELYADSASRCCFHWDSVQVERTLSGHPKQKNRPLRQWLTSKLNSAPDRFGIPPEPPLAENGGVSVLPEYWDEYLLRACGLRAWSTLWAAADSLDALRRASNAQGRRRLKSEYRFWPRTRSKGPDLRRLHEIVRRTRLRQVSRTVCDSARPAGVAPDRGAMRHEAVFEADPGSQFVVGRFPRLLIHCYAWACEADGGGSQLGGCILGECDPVHETAKRMYAFDEVPSVHNPYAVEHKMAEFDGLPETAPDAYRELITQSEVFLEAKLTGWGTLQVRERLETDHRIRLSEAGGRDRIARLLEAVVDLQFVADHDSTTDIARAKLRCGPGELFDVLREGSQQAANGALRALIAGTTSNCEAFAALRKVCRDEYWRGRFDGGRGNPELYREFFGQQVVSPMGRVQKGVYFTRARAAVHVGLADDVLKSVLFELVAAGYDLVAFDGDEFVIQVPASDISEALLGRIRSTAERASGRILGLFPPRCEVRDVPLW